MQGSFIINWSYLIKGLYKGPYGFQTYAELYVYGDESLERMCAHI